MKKSILICFIILLLSSCIHTEVFQHPDYNYAQTIPANVKIYTAELRPLQKYIIIGKMKMKPSPLVSSKAITEEMQVRAAFIGGDGVIITNQDVNIYAYNRGTVTQGALWGTRNYLQYNQRTRDTTTYVRRITLYGYVIKFKTQ